MPRPKDFVFTTEKGLTYKLTEKEKRFCEIYCQFGVSGTEAAYQAGYRSKDDNTAASIASEYLRKPNILAYIELLYKDFQITDEDVMREHLYLIKQHHSLSNKARAIDMYYKKKGLYAQPIAATPTTAAYNALVNGNFEISDDLIARIAKDEHSESKNANPG